MRLINADKFIENCKEIIADGWNQMSGPSSWARAYEDVIDEINEQPTVDAVEVVRCKDCVDFVKGKDKLGEIRYCNLNSIYGCDDNSFCSFGRKKR